MGLRYFAGTGGDSGKGINAAAPSPQIGRQDDGPRHALGAEPNGQTHRHAKGDGFAADIEVSPAALVEPAIHAGQVNRAVVGGQSAQFGFKSGKIGKIVFG